MRKQEDGEGSLSMMPMVDIVFLLLIFFLLSAKFVTFEGELSTYLPKNRGLHDSLDFESRAEVIVDLAWRDDEALATAWMTGIMVGTSGDVVRFGPRAGREDGYVAPNFGELEVYLTDRVQRFGREMPVTVHFEDGVPMQMVVDVVDVCERLGIRGVAVGAAEIES